MHRERANPDQVALIHRRSETRWENMTFSQKTVDFTARHQFSAIAGCWALGIAGAFGVIMRNPYVAREKKRENEWADKFEDIKVCHKRYGTSFDHRNHGSLISQLNLDRASENVVAGDHNWGGHCCSCGDKNSDVPA